MFVTFEGIEGSGKSTVMELCAAEISKNAPAPLLTREPGGCQLGRRLRGILLDSRAGHMAPGAEFFLFMADRAQHVEEIIRPALEEGRVVFCDRFVDSTIAYQGFGRGMDFERLIGINRLATGGLEPDLTLLLDLPVSVGLGRAGSRNRDNGTFISEGRFDSESVDFHERVREGYLALASKEPDRIIVIDADRPLPEVTAAALAALNARF